MALTPEQATSLVNDLYRELSSRRPAIEECDRYFNGEQKLCYASKEFAEFYADRYKGFADNWCQVVGRAAPDLTEFRSVKLGDDGDAMSRDEQVLLDDWERNDGPAQSAEGFLSGAVTRRSFAMVWGSPNDEPVLTWEHSAQCIIGYDPETRAARWGLKAWVDGPREYATLYTADELWRFERPSQYTKTETSTRLILPSWFEGWQPRAGVEQVQVNPLGMIPLVEFPNRPQLRTGPISDIEGTMAAQNAINLLWALLFNAADYASMPARVVLAQGPPKIPILDDKGQKVGEKPVDMETLRNRRMAYFEGQDTRIDQWDAADLNAFADVINRLVRHVMSQTQTPARYFTGEMNNINGATISGLDLPLVQKVRAGHKFLTGPMREVLRRMALVRGNAGVAEACRTARIGWMNPENSSDAQQADAALKDKQIGWSFAGILQHRYGLSQQEIDDELERRRADRASDPLIEAANSLGAADAAGGI